MTELPFSRNVGIFENPELRKWQLLFVFNFSPARLRFQNVHLVKKWLPMLEKKLEQYSLESHEDYRVYISAEPAGEPSAHIIPQGILEAAIKITNEPPTGMHANLHKALDNFNQVGRKNSFDASVMSPDNLDARDFNQI